LEESGLDLFEVLFRDLRVMTEENREKISVDVERVP